MVFDNGSYISEGEITVEDIGANFLEKINGEWKIVYLSRVGISSYSGGFKEIRVSEEVLTTYTGKYELNPGFFATITQEGGHLYIEPTGQLKMEMFTYAENKFFFITAYAHIE